MKVKSILIIIALTALIVKHNLAAAQSAGAGPGVRLTHWKTHYCGIFPPGCLNTMCPAPALA